MCVLINKFLKVKNILNGIFILLPWSCPGVGLWDAGGVKKFSAGICDGAQSTAHSRLVFFCSCHNIL